MRVRGGGWGSEGVESSLVFFNLDISISVFLFFCFKLVGGK